ncbi:MAG TPA: carboxylesterase/lipase family protein [Aquabacterium sp.]|uniref:carboxylesterase/lipase family protein n=1 Tax=Aquabacterium sp. TaxID=1872578 RepID=UPI002E36BA07|nr:carboxylesterase/lipase family protein [Aquabacterium sp.]HEX5356124.1 carboxylesterase/lipase family protein [Aquabacterium sp.]
MRQQIVRLLASWAAGAALLSSAHADTFASSPPIVQTSQGAISGKLVNAVRAYLGIPYAAPPVGELRWQSPQAPATWSGTRDGTSFGQRCAQPLSIVSPESINEDCLFLNVHVPDDIGSSKLPVMVWIHGGAFLSGSAADYDMTTLARKGRAVVVSINYRVGAFGFFRQPELAAQNVSPNLGLQDQQAALRWVQSQIGHFGGDPSRVTIFGHSAGGASTCLHLVSPQSKGLFHRAISQSGPCNLLTDATPASMEAQSVALGVKLGCAEGPGQLACMRHKSAEDIMRGSVPNGNEVNGVNIRWTPVQDGLTLTGDPARQVRDGQFNRVPVIIGTTHDEGRLFVGTEYHQANQWFVTRADVNAYINKIAGNDTALARKLTSTYSFWHYGTLDKAFSAMLTDYFFSCGAMADAEALSRYVPTYNYEFTEPNSPAPTDPLMSLGAFHGAELTFVFQRNMIASPTPLPPLNAAQQKLSDQMVRYWGRFAATGNPNTFLPPYWPAFQAQRASSLKLDSSGISVFGAPAFKQDHQCGLYERP